MRRRAGARRRQARGGEGAKQRARSVDIVALKRGDWATARSPSRREGEASDCDWIWQVAHVRLYPWSTPADMALSAEQISLRAHRALEVPLLRFLGASLVEEEGAPPSLSMIFSERATNAV